MSIYLCHFVWFGGSPHCTAFQAVGYLLYSAYSPPAYHDDVAALPDDEVGGKVFLYLCLLCHLSLSTCSPISLTFLAQIAGVAVLEVA